jgi:hypothetical protein
MRARSNGWAGLGVCASLPAGTKIFKSKAFLPRHLGTGKPIKP